jgi:hypothetical protein
LKITQKIVKINIGYFSLKRNEKKLHIAKFNNGSFFVTRAKDNIQFQRMYSKAVDNTTGVWIFTDNTSHPF